MFTPMSLLLGSIHTVTALMVLSLAILLYRGWLPGNGPYYKFVSLMEDDYDMMQLSRYIGRMYVIWSLLYLTTAAVMSANIILSHTKLPDNLKKSLFFVRS